MSIIRPLFRGEDYLAAVDDVYAERLRQIHEEGFDETHDDRHLPGDLVNAARCYFNHPAAEHSYADGKPRAWQWAWAWWKPGDRRTNLVKAGALALAEEERAVRNGYDPAADQAGELLSDVFAELANLLMCEKLATGQGQAQPVQDSDPGVDHAEG